MTEPTIYTTIADYIKWFEREYRFRPSIQQCVAFRIEQNLWREIFEGKPSKQAESSNS